MRIAILALALSARLLPPGPADELKGLQGTWVLVKVEFDGRIVPEKEIAGTKLIINNAMLLMIEQGEKKHVGVIVLNSDKTPAWFDVNVTNGVNKGKISPGIFRLAGDRLTLCQRQPGRDRPDRFSSGMDTSLLHLVREK